jgi:CheY-like chemotaxis protein
MSAPVLNLLLVEDDPNDVFFLLRAFTRGGLPKPVYTCTDGQEAIDYLSGGGKFADRATYPLPQGIFLDLKLPLIHGFQVLEWIRERPGLDGLPVFVLTSSPEESDRQRALRLGATAYFVKPPTDQMVTVAFKRLRDASVNTDSGRANPQ